MLRLTIGLAAFVVAASAQTVAQEPAVSTSMQGSVETTLNGGDESVVSAQRALALFMGWRAESPSGVVAAGDGVSVTDLDTASVQAELETPAPIHRFFRVDGHGPTPIQVFLPPLPGGGPLELYRRLGPGLFFRPVNQPILQNGRFLIRGLFPGAYLARPVDAYSTPNVKAGLFDFPALSSAPEAKAAWGFQRVDPDTVDGPIPVILVGGLSSDRWDELREWAVASPGAEAFRTTFQLWRYVHPMDGVNASVGFSTEYPGFEESLTAYLNRYIDTAESEGVETDGTVYHFPEGPFCFITHSQGGIVVRALWQAFPDKAERTLAAVTLSAPHTGTPWATPEWTRHTLSRLGFALPLLLKRIVPGAIAEFALQGYLSTGRQADLDTGWLNADAGIPTIDFQAWRPGFGVSSMTVSPRDANQTNARLLADIADNTFEPPLLLDTFSGGLDEITPASRGEMYADKLFLYGAFIDPSNDLVRWLTGEARPAADPFLSVVENAALRLVHQVMGLVKSDGNDFPTPTYFLGDGFVPLQSQLMLDGEETELIYRTHVSNGWHRPVSPAQPRMDIISAHTLGDPTRLRLLRGWSHLDTVTGRYDRRTQRSELFDMIAADLLSVAPAAP